MNQVHAAPGSGVSGPVERWKRSESRFEVVPICAAKKQEWGLRFTEGGLEGVPDLGGVAL